MGVTGSGCFDRWSSLTDPTLTEKYNALERKFTMMETNNNTLHTKYSVLEGKLDVLTKKVGSLTADVEVIIPKLDHVEKKASNMLFQQEEMDCDIVIIP